MALWAVASIMGDTLAVPPGAAAGLPLLPWARALARAGDGCRCMRTALPGLPSELSGVGSRLEPGGLGRPQGEGQESASMSGGERRERASCCSSM